MEKEKLPKARRNAGYVDHEDALAEKRHIDYLVLTSQIDNLKKAIEELEKMKIKDQD